MELKTVEDVEAFSSLQITNRIQKIQKTINRLDYVPAISLFCMLIYAGVIQFSSLDFSGVAAFILLAGNIPGIGQASMKKSDLLHELSELKTNESA